MNDFARNLDTYNDGWDENPCLECGRFGDCDCYLTEEKPESDYCPHCGKDRYDFSEIGCSACDVRHPNFGVLP